MRAALKLLLLIGAGALVLVFGPQVPGVLMVGTPKTGRVVDAESGEGLADAFVVATAHYDGQHLIHGSDNEWLYREVVRTDSNGNYRVPGAWTHTRVGGPWSNAHLHWYLTAFKPGYAIASDRDSWMAASRDQARITPKSIDASPPAIWFLFGVAVDPIEMAPVRLPVEKAASYYARITGAGYDIRSRFAPSEIALREAGNRLFETELCAIDPEQRLPWSFAMGAFVHDETTFSESLKDLEPDTFKLLNRGRSWPGYTAKTVCQAMRVAKDRAPEVDRRPQLPKVVIKIPETTPAKSR